MRNTAGKVFGPIDFETLKSWVRDGRVEPLAGISENLQDWMLAPLKAELEMDWVIENNPGQFYGPTHRAVVDDFVRSGTLSDGARFYRDDRGRSERALAALAAERDALTVERDTLKAERDALAAAKANEARKAAETAKRYEDEVAKLKEEVDGLKAEKEAVHAREWKTEVLVPEVVVSSEPPPPVARTAFGGQAASLAALERQAQAELARMGASGAKKFFKFGKKQ